MSKTKISIIAILVLLAFITIVVATYFIYGRYFLKDESRKPQKQEITVAETKEFLMTAEDFKFSPKTISVKQGEKVRLTIKSIKGIHDFKIDNIDVSINKQAEGVQIVEFSADIKGKYLFYCPIEGHKQKGMTGTLIVN